MDVCRCQLYFRDGGIEMSPRLSGFWRLPRIAHNQLATSNDDRRCLNSIEIERPRLPKRGEKKLWNRCLDDLRQFEAANMLRSFASCYARPTLFPALEPSLMAESKPGEYVLRMMPRSAISCNTLPCTLKAQRKRGTAILSPAVPIRLFLPMTATCSDNCCRVQGLLDRPKTRAPSGRKWPVFVGMRGIVGEIPDNERHRLTCCWARKRLKIGIGNGGPSAGA